MTLTQFIEYNAAGVGTIYSHSCPIPQYEIGCKVMFQITTKEPIKTAVIVGYQVVKEAYQFQGEDCIDENVDYKLDTGDIIPEESIVGLSKV